MATLENPSINQVDCLQIVEDEIAAARKAQKPMSRQALAQLVSRRTGMPSAEAIAIVEAFCDEREPGLPEYLASEFVIGWLKVVAIAEVVVGGVLFFYTARAHENGQPIWVLLAAGTVFVGLGALSWVKSLEREVDNTKRG